MTRPRGGRSGVRILSISSCPCACAWTSRDCCRAQGHDERDTFFCTTRSVIDGMNSFNRYHDCAMGCTARNRVFDSPIWQEILLSETYDRLWCPANVQHGGYQQQGREANHSLSFSAEVNDLRTFASTCPYSVMVWCLIQHWT